ncbi:MAG: excinuclease ABC subunit C [Actinobacteria bacterium]|nr:excinuclease ABC subunit C [Actinomycetota bacterium]
MSEKIKSLPGKPGVYVFKDSSGQIIYAGKAKSLKSRVRSYFQKNQDRWPLAKIMINRIADLDFYITDNEIEALILESNLIKKYKPVYNVRLIDDKSYPYLAIALNDEFTRVAVTREIHKKETKYYGPYTNAKALRQTLDVLRKVFPFRTCRGSKAGRANGSPCLNYHIKRCLGPCIGKVEKEDYLKMINEICLFLEGKEDEVVDDLKKQMKEASDNLEYEKAARLRNRIMAANQILEKQRVIFSESRNQDIVGIMNDEITALVKLFVVRQGKLIGS